MDFIEKAKESTYEKPMLSIRFPLSFWHGEGHMLVDRNQTLSILLIASAALIFVVGSALVIYQNNLVRGSTDLYPTWQGAKLFWEDNISPYNELIGEKSQQKIYGGPAEEDEDEFQFVYPFYLIFYIGPLSLLEFKLAAAIFMEILLLLLAGTVAITLDILKWFPKPVTLGLTILLVLTGYFSVRGLLLGQPAFLAYALHMIAYWGLAHRHNRLSGAALALSTIKPQTGFLIVPLLLLWAGFNHRRDVVYAFTLTLTLLFAVSFILLPTWFSDWIDRVISYRAYTETVPTTQIVTHAIDTLPNLATAAAQVILSIIILIPIGLFWKRAILDGDKHNFLWGVMLTMTAGLLVAPRVATTYYVELYPALFVGMMMLEKRGQIGMLVMLTLVFIIGYWALHIATAPPAEEAGKEAPIVYVVFPVLVYLWLLWRRADWADINILDRL